MAKSVYAIVICAPVAAAWTVAVDDAETPKTLAVMTVWPAATAVTVTCAAPVESVVTDAGTVAMLGRLEVRVTTWLASGLLLPSKRWTKSGVVPEVATEIEVGRSVSDGVPIPTTTVAVAVTPEVTAMTVVLPAATPFTKKGAVPSSAVTTEGTDVPVVSSIVAIVASPVESPTVTPESGLPLWSVTETVQLAVAPAPTERDVGESVTSGAPGAGGAIAALISRSTAASVAASRFPSTSV